MDAGNIAVIAGQELRITLRSKWIQIFAVVFGLLTIAISYFGMVTSIVVGFEGFTRTTASLLNLVLYFVPMLALAAATFSSAEIKVQPNCCFPSRCCALKCSSAKSWASLCLSRVRSSLVLVFLDSLSPPSRGWMASCDTSALSRSPCCCC